MKLLLVTSPGGHIYAIQLLKEWWNKHDRVWICPDSPDAKYLLKHEKWIKGFGPENRSLINLWKNFWLAFKVIKQEKPDLIFSCGAAMAPPFFWVGKLFGIKSIFLETYDFIDEPSLSAWLVMPVATHLLVQHQSLVKKLPRSSFKGSLL